MLVTQRDDGLAVVVARRRVGAAVRRWAHVDVQRLRTWVLGAAQGDTLDLKLFDDLTVTIAHDTAETTTSGALIAHATIPGKPLATVTLALREGTTGLIHRALRPVPFPSGGGCPFEAVQELRDRPFGSPRVNSPRVICSTARISEASAVAILSVLSTIRGQGSFGHGSAQEYACVL